jgi:hypothetical protein
MFSTQNNEFTREGSGNHQAKWSKEGKNPTGLSPKNRMECHSISTALLHQNVAKIGTQSTMKSSKKTLHEFSPKESTPTLAQCGTVLAQWYVLQSHERGLAGSMMNDEFEVCFELLLSAVVLANRRV